MDKEENILIKMHDTYSKRQRKGDSNHSMQFKLCKQHK